MTIVFIAVTEKISGREMLIALESIESVFQDVTCVLIKTKSGQSFQVTNPYAQILERLTRKIPT